jgi:hypothetical protein
MLLSSETGNRQEVLLDRGQYQQVGVVGCCYDVVRLKSVGGEGFGREQAYCCRGEADFLLYVGLLGPSESSANWPSPRVWNHMACGHQEIDSVH